MKNLVQFIKESIFEDASEGYTINNLIVRYDCPANFYIQIPEKYSESEMQIYLDDSLLENLPAASKYVQKFFGKNKDNIVDVYFEYDSIDQAMGKDQTVDLVWNERYDSTVKDSDELAVYQIKNLKYIIEFEKFEFDNTVNDENVQGTLETLFQSTVSNNINKYSVEISLNNSNISFENE